MQLLACALLWLGLGLAKGDATIPNPGDVVPALHVPILNGTVIDTSTLNRPLLVAVYSPSDVFSRLGAHPITITFTTMCKQEHVGI